ncbi:hypothetical protein BABINDRAFT_162341 [Babjeviella inositovora NRRL Y-12698]|uniref:Endonuclease III homolog n=1 Tax=Babjeviella inositovora NRRL Y-12698 TaxID=984486 RepID=A0A1E3QLS2_9ASCO|nr:uncharacterized protein BABINDRAFT_162341 [Babjeviella inositovora NRRL Y-12698]ODQ78631.1 hypothetical protein BABINDRAFT_162341 [Babjeviella inositovora NRRL Y-12698]
MTYRVLRSDIPRKQYVKVKMTTEGLATEHSITVKCELPDTIPKSSVLNVKPEDVSILEFKPEDAILKIKLEDTAIPGLKTENAPPGVKPEDENFAIQEALAAAKVLKPSTLVKTAEKKLKTEDTKAKRRKTQANETKGSGTCPPHWEEIYSHVSAMRSKIVAPVDTMGCERLPERVAGKTTPRNFRFQLLISLMMSSQTKDEVNYQAMLSLHEGLILRGFKEGLTLEAILATEERDIDAMIRKVGFHNRKALYIKKTSVLLRDNFNSDIPKTIEEIVSLPGVGPKMGFLLLQRAWNVVTGIGVDVHVFRLANMWRWVPQIARPTPEHTRVELEKWLPRDKWIDINPLLVGFGQTVCLPKGARCDLCSLARTGLCSGVNRKLLNKPKSTTSKNRGDISGLVDIEDLA